MKLRRPCVAWNAIGPIRSAISTSCVSYGWLSPLYLVFVGFLANADAKMDTI
jgi:hypothetical protein